jgi:hypothetical protein
MAGSEPALHYVCTWDEAAELLATHEAFWVSPCGCRESHGGCIRSRHDVCLQFHPRTAADPTGIRPISREEAEGILQEARAIPLVTRPFRGWEDRTVTEGICFCCDDCCGYFRNREERCDRGRFVQSTRRRECNDCGECVEVCLFGARAMTAGRLDLTNEDCYGCGLYVSHCPLGSIEMTECR